MGVNNPKISGFVITYNSGEILKTCLRSSRLEKTLKKIRSHLTGRRR